MLLYKVSICDSYNDCRILNAHFETEKEFLMGLLSLADRPTIIIVTHKVQLLEYCDSIIKLENHKIS